MKALIIFFATGTAAAVTITPAFVMVILPLFLICLLCKAQEEKQSKY